MKKSTVDERLGISAVAKILGVTTQRVDQLVKAGKLSPCDSTPLGRLFARQDVEALARKRAAK